MKKFVIAVIVLAMGLPMAAQIHWNNGFTAEAAFMNTGGHKKNEPAFRKFQGITISAGYKSYLCKGLFIKPEASLYYEDHNYIEPLVDGGPGPDKEGHASEFGIGIGFYAGYNIPVGKLTGIEPITGIGYSYAFDQHETDGYERHTMYPYNRSSLRWRFGININVWKIKVGVAYDVAMLKINGGSECREKNVFSALIGYNF